MVLASKLEAHQVYFEADFEADSEIESERLEEFSLSTQRNMFGS